MEATNFHIFYAKLFKREMVEQGVGLIIVSVGIIARKMQITAVAHLRNTSLKLRLAIVIDNIFDIIDAIFMRKRKSNIFGAAIIVR